MRTEKNPQNPFLNLEKKKALQGQIRKLIIDNQEVMDQNKIQNEIPNFYKIFSNLTVQNHMMIVKRSQ